MSLWVRVRASHWTSRWTLGRVSHALVSGPLESPSPAGQARFRSEHSAQTLASPIQARHVDGESSAGPASA
jgi:hypothetical protein